MRKKIVKRNFILLLLLNSIIIKLYSQENLPVDWDFYARPIFKDAIIKYEKSLNGAVSIYNFNIINDNPPIGILLAQVNYDSIKNVTKIKIWCCYDENWKKYKFDYFSFVGGKLILINRNSGNYPTIEMWDEIVQNRVYTRKPSVKRIAISEKSIPYKKLKLKEFQDESFLLDHGPYQIAQAKAPYNFREIIINHIKNTILVL